MATDDGKPPPRKRAARKVAAKKQPARKRAARKPTPTKTDRAKAAEQIATVTPIKGGTTSQRGRHNANSKGKGRHSPTSPESLKLHERRAMAVDLRRMGMQWKQVAQTIHEQRPDLVESCPSYDHSKAYEDHKALIDSVTVEAVQGVREEDLATLLALQRRVYVKAVNDGDLKAVATMLKILDQRAKYLGLYAPTRHELTGSGGGPIGLAPQATAVEIFEAAYTALDQALPHTERMTIDPPPSAP